MKNFLFAGPVLTFLVASLLSLTSCGKKGDDGSDGIGSTTFGINGVSTGVDIADIDPSLACANGGISIYTFIDDNSDGKFESGEEILKVKSLCHGTNGTNGSNGTITLESVDSSLSCPNGGVKISSSTSSGTEICNGVNGLNGEQGLPGIQGIPGLAGSNGAAGSDGTVVTPVKFCESDDSTFPEYGLMIGDELFAVYWGSTPASPKTPQAFLTKLVTGDYQSTGGNNCLFTIK